MLPPEYILKGEIHMDIERINDHTIKFYITYGDIEDRGFKREEIWYDRERSEQLFWQMMEEVNDQEDFVMQGPLWIQVQALEKGLEIIVTKAQIPQGKENVISIDGLKEIETSIHHENVEKLLEEKFGTSADAQQETDGNDEDSEDYFWMIASFKDFEDVIQLSHYFADVTEPMESVLYAYKNNYYMYIEFADDIVDDARKEDLISRVLEFGVDSDKTIHVLEEYGKEIFSDAISQVRTYFSV